MDNGSVHPAPALSAWSDIDNVAPRIINVRHLSLYHSTFVRLRCFLTFIIIIIAPVTSTPSSLPVVMIHPETVRQRRRFLIQCGLWREEKRTQETFMQKHVSSGRFPGSRRRELTAELRGNTRAPATTADRWMTRGKLNGNPEQPFRSGLQLQARKTYWRNSQS